MFWKFIVLALQHKTQTTTIKFEKETFRKKTHHNLTFLHTFY